MSFSKTNFHRGYKFDKFALFDFCFSRGHIWFLQFYFSFQFIKNGFLELMLKPYREKHYVACKRLNMILVLMSVSLDKK